MNLDDLQKAWQSQDARKTISINADALLSEVRRNQQQFRATIFARDTREVFVAAVMVVVFIVMGRQLHNWTNYLVAAACFVVGGYILLDRWRRRGRSPESGDALTNSIAASLAEVRHQIWLLKNILWWYLLPLFVPIVVSMAWPAMRSGHGAVAKISFLIAPITAVGLVYSFLYWLNQSAVKKTLMPRKRELEGLLSELGAEEKLSERQRKKPICPLLIVLLITAISLICDSFVRTRAVTNSPPANAIDAIRQQLGVPALAVVVAKDGQIRDRAAAGVRKSGDDTPITTNDVFHIGSCTKSMTATLAAKFIEEGKLHWDTTIGEGFPELKGKMDNRYEAVTVEQLLHHRGGVPGSPPDAAWRRAWQEIGSPMQQRREYIEAVLTAPPETAPGTKMIYSNEGYVIVGAMLEKIAGEEFESLMAEKLFKPLHMDTAGFGVPGTKGKTDQPWGHLRNLFGNSPVQEDNPPVHSPCGRVHCSLDDLARYAMFHLQQTNALLKPATMARLHAAPAGVEIRDVMDNYACGWVRMKRDWAGGDVLWHNGSNTMWYIVMWLAPEKNCAVIAATNVAGSDAEKACDDAAVAMIHKWLPR